MAKVARALLSVSDKRGLVEFAKGLANLGIALLSTGGTAKALREARLTVRDVAEVTGFPEMLGGRVKTLHPKIHGGILARRRDPAHQRDLAAHGIEPIDLVVVNLYPFVETVTRPGIALAEALEQIDIGGPALVRAAAKNFPDVGVIVDPSDYPACLAELARAGALSDETRARLAAKAFDHTALYDGVIAAYLTAQGTGRGGASRFPPALALTFEKVQDLRYGENPHQAAALYRERSGSEPGLAGARQLHGKALSFNNLLDADAALGLAREFTEPCAVVVKHMNPCGVAIDDAGDRGDLAAAYREARACDPVAAFGGVVAVNRPVDLKTAEALIETFIEIVIAPEVAPDALTRLQTKRDLRILTAEFTEPHGDDVRRIAGGLLVQERDRAGRPDPAAWKVVTRRRPTPAEEQALAFAFTVAKYVKSNAIVFAAEHRTLGIGAGQMSRVDAVRVARMKASGPLAGAVMASDAFFPFRDGIDVVSEAGIAAVIQPGGSIRDAEVVQAADEHGMAMVLTGVRHFRH